MISMKKFSTRRDFLLLLKKTFCPFQRKVPIFQEIFSFSPIKSFSLFWEDLLLFSEMSSHLYIRMFLFLLGFWGKNLWCVWRRYATLLGCASLIRSVALRATLRYLYTFWFFIIKPCDRLQNIIQFSISRPFVILTDFLAVSNTFLFCFAK